MTRNHRIDYTEFSVSDMEASQRFYARAFGWCFTDYAPTYAGIRASAEDGQEMGGFVQVEDVPAGGGTLAVLYCEDLEATRQRVIDAGGEITQDIFSFPGGRRFEFQAPGGSRAAVWAEAGD